MVNYTPKLRKISKEQKSVLVKEIMNKNFKSLNRDDDISKAIRTLLDEKISGIIVLEESKPVGFLSVKDCLSLGLDMKYHNEPPNKVHEYMSKEVKTIDENSDIFDLIELFTHSQYRIVPVVDEVNNVLGVVDRRLALIALDKMLQTTW